MIKRPPALQFHARPGVFSADTSAVLPRGKPGKSFFLFVVLFLGVHRLCGREADLESQRPDTGTRYNDYIVDSVTVLSVDGVQHSTFRRVGQSLLLEEDTHYSGGSVSFQAWLQ